MNIEDLSKIVFYILASIATSSAILFFLIKWGAKLLADRIIEKRKAELKKEVDEFRINLEAKNDVTLEKLKSDLDIFKITNLTALNEKVKIYRLATDIFSDLIANMDYDLITIEKRFIFNRERLKLYGYMGMIAPQRVMDACDKLTDYMFDVFEEKDKYNWKQLRELALVLLNEIRKDININTSSIVYNGPR
jgi:hypothetical protein